MREANQKETQCDREIVGRIIWGREEGGRRDGRRERGRKERDQHWLFALLTGTKSTYFTGTQSTCLLVEQYNY
jgi:hypothetical protein